MAACSCERTRKGGNQSPRYRSTGEGTHVCSYLGSRISRAPKNLVLAPSRYRINGTMAHIRQGRDRDQNNPNSDEARLRFSLRRYGADRKSSLHTPRTRGSFKPPFHASVSAQTAMLPT